MFQFPGFALNPYGFRVQYLHLTPCSASAGSLLRSQYKGSKVGFPIRRSLDQSSFAAPQGISQRTTSFIASQRQGIHQMLLRHLITLTIDVRMPSAKRADMIIKERPVLGFLPRHLFACQAYPARTAAGRRWFAGLGARSPNMLPLYDFKHPRLSHDERTRTSDKIHPRMDTGYFNTTQGKWWSLSGSNRRPEACKATALPAELRPLGEAKVWSWPLLIAAPRTARSASP